MQQSIRYRGLSLTPDEMAVENGALSLCGNLELHDGALRPSFVSGTVLGTPYVDNPGDTKIVYVHETGSYQNFIGYFQGQDSLEWFDDGMAYMTTIMDFRNGDFISATSVGNTLVIICTDGVYYAIFKDGDYEYLGKKPPFVDIRFYISTKDYAEDYPTGGVDATGSTNGFTEAWQQSTVSCSDAYVKTSGEKWHPGDLCVSIKEDKQSDLTQSIYALVNRTNNLIAKQGRFYANFFIRYCFRMFDGSMIMHSSPVFIPVQVPNSYLVQAANFRFSHSSFSSGSVNDYGYWNEGATINSTIEYDNQKNFNRKDSAGNALPVSFNGATFYYYPRNVALLYSVFGKSALEELKKWSDVIKSIDFFITPPITNVDVSEKIENLQIRPKNYSLGYGQRACIYENSTDKYGFVTVKFPSFSEDEYKKKIKNTSAFFKVCSIRLDELRDSKGIELPVDKSAVYQVSLQEQMKDDYKTHNTLSAQGGYVYNHRLNLFGITEKLFEGFSDAVMFPHGEYVKQSSSVKYLIEKIVVRLNTTSGTKYVEKKGKFVTEYTYSYIERFLLCNAVKFYPDSRADKMVIFTKRDSDDEEVIFAFDLEQCEELNGAISIGDFTSDTSEYEIRSFDYKINSLVELPNKIYTSESDNAFYFPVNGINTVGIGTILGIASTTRALSQGQFGQYPLMAFSTDGIWALNVSSSGTYSNIQPISREVCSNPKSITQLDQSVAFATNRSFSRVAESQVVSMSDGLDGPGFNIADNLGKFLNFFNDEEGDDDLTKNVKTQMRQLIDFTSSPIDFFQNCQVIYDYKNSRLFCLDVGQLAKEASADTVALCYSIKDEAWSTFLIKNVLTALNSYPHPYIQYRDGSVQVLDKGYDYHDDTEYHGIIVTRTLKFDEENAPDSITGYIHSLTSGSVPVMWLYGSNDNQHWHYAGRVGGMKSNYMASHSYRFFRIALYLKMKSMQQYFATRLEVIRRFNKF